MHVPIELDDFVKTFLKFFARFVFVFKELDIRRPTGFAPSEVQNPEAICSCSHDVEAAVVETFELSNSCANTDASNTVFTLHRSPWRNQYDAEGRRLFDASIDHEPVSFFE